MEAPVSPGRGVWAVPGALVSPRRKVPSSGRSHVAFPAFLMELCVSACGALEQPMLYQTLHCSCCWNRLGVIVPQHLLPASICAVQPLNTY